ncbi:MAG: hypothetical protein WA948_12740 [Pontixanthobacter sp.]
MTREQARSEWIEGIGNDYDHFKTFVEAALNIHNDATHVLAGFGIFAVFAIILRRPLASWLGFVVVLLLALANEWYDLTAETWPDFGMQAGESAKDIALTIAVPAALMLLRYLLPIPEPAEPASATPPEPPPEQPTEPPPEQPPEQPPEPS